MIIDLFYIGGMLFVAVFLGVSIRFIRNSGSDIVIKFEGGKKIETKREIEDLELHNQEYFVVKWVGSPNNYTKKILTSIKLDYPQEGSPYEEIFKRVTSGNNAMSVGRIFERIELSLLNSEPRTLELIDIKLKETIISFESSFKSILPVLFLLDFEEREIIKDKALKLLSSIIIFLDGEVLKFDPVEVDYLTELIERHESGNKYRI